MTKMLNLRNLSRGASAAVIGMLAVCLLAGTALAYWTISGTGTGQATAGTLGAPTNVQTPSSTATSVALTWSAPSSGATPTGYTVTADGTNVPSCTVTTTSCTATGLASSRTYSFIVSSRIGTAWSAAAQAKDGTTSAAAPTVVTPIVTITTPTAGQTGVSTTPTFTGTASATTTVTIKVYETSDTATVNLKATVAAPAAASPWTSAAVSPALKYSTEYTAVAEQTNSAGTGFSAKRSFTTGAQPQTAAPTALDLTTASDSGTSNSDNITNVARPTFSGLAAANSLVRLYRAGVEIGSVQLIAGATNWSITPAADVAEGVGVAVTATAQTTGLAESAASTALDVTFDRTVPTVTGLKFSGPSDADGNGIAAAGDILTITYSTDVAASTICTAWNNTTSIEQTRTGNNADAVIGRLVSNAIATDDFTVLVGTSATNGCATFRFGAVATKINYKNTPGNVDFSGNGSSRTGLGYTASTGTLRVVLGDGTATGATGNAAAIPTYTPASGITDIAGNPLATTPVNGTSSRF